jgi:parallel beta-helix repeat protein
MNCNGITLDGSAASNIIYSNILEDNTVAVNLTASSTSNTIYKNIISSNNIGVALESSGHVIYANTISENQLGIEISTDGNIIYHNNFINNKENARSELLTNAWDNGYPSGGNFWSDYVSADLKNGANQDVAGSDGIGDTKYTIATNNVDRYPLLQPFNPHDIGITNVVTTKTVVGKGFTARVDLKILNYGIYDETFAVAVYANNTAIATQIVVLASRNSMAMSFEWDTTGFAKGNYTVWAFVWPVQDETDTADNTFVGGIVSVAMIGDVNADGIVEMMDFYILSQHYMHSPPDGHMIGTAHYHECFNADVNSDGTIEMMDFYIASLHYMKPDP